jgi:hypothetical protein
MGRKKIRIEKIENVRQRTVSHCFQLPGPADLLSEAQARAFEEGHGDHHVDGLLGHPDYLRPNRVSRHKLY